MPFLSRTDAASVSRYLRDAARYMDDTCGKSTRISNRARLMRLLANKIERITDNEKDKDYENRSLPRLHTRRTPAARERPCHSTMQSRHEQAATGGNGKDSMHAIRA